MSFDSHGTKYLLPYRDHTAMFLMKFLVISGSALLLGRLFEKLLFQVLVEKLSMVASFRVMSQSHLLADLFCSSGWAEMLRS